MEYTSLFLSAFIAATLLPFSSEAVLLGLIVAGGVDVPTLWIVATAGNTLGAMVNWVLGKWCLHWRDRRWFPFSNNDLAKAQRWFEHWGVWSLLLSWVPIIGDPITFAAGFLRIRFPVFFTLVLFAKGGRYLVVVALALGLF